MHIARICVCSFVSICIANLTNLTKTMKANLFLFTEHPIYQPTYVNMSELASMAALKITNSINQHYQQQNQQPLTPPSHTSSTQFSAPSPSSDTSSINMNNIPTNSSTTTTNADNSPDVSSITATDTLSQQTISPTNTTQPSSTTNNSRSSRQASIETPIISTANDIDDYSSDMNHASTTILSMSAGLSDGGTAIVNCSSSLTTSNNHLNNTQYSFLNNSLSITTSSTHSDDTDDYKSTGSVLEKLSMFEKLEQQHAVAAATALSLSSSSGASMTSMKSGIEGPLGVKKYDELSKSLRSIDKDPGKLISNSMPIEHLTFQLLMN